MKSEYQRGQASHIHIGDYIQLSDEGWTEWAKEQVGKVTAIKGNKVLHHLVTMKNSNSHIEHLDKWGFRFLSKDEVILWRMRHNFDE